MFATQRSGALTSIPGESGSRAVYPYRRIANDVKRRRRGRDKSTGKEAQAPEVQNFVLLLSLAGIALLDRLSVGFGRTVANAPNIARPRTLSV